MKDWGIDLALQISRRPEVHYLDCSISWGGRGHSVEKTVCAGKVRCVMVIRCVSLSAT